MIELLKFTKVLEEKLVSGKRDFQNPWLIENVIIDSFILGFMQGKLANSYQQYNQFLQNLQIVQQLRQFIDINLYQTNSLIQVYNNVFIERNNLTYQYEQVEQKIFLDQIELEPKQQVQSQPKQEESKMQNQIQSFNESQMIQSSQLQQVPLPNSPPLQQINYSSGFNNPFLANAIRLNESNVMPAQFSPLNQFSNQSLKSPTQLENFQKINSNSESNPPQKSNQFEKPRTSSIQFKIIEIKDLEAQQDQAVKQQNELKPIIPFIAPSPIKQQFQQSNNIQNQQNDSFKQSNPFNTFSNLRRTNLNFISQQQTSQIKTQKSFYEQKINNQQFQPQFRQQNIEKYDQNSFMVSQLQQIRQTQNNNQFQQQELRITNNVKKMQTITKPFNSNQQKLVPAQIHNGQFEKQSSQLDDESFTLAQQLQQQFDQENIQMVCEICLEPMQIHDMMILNCCQQFYHSACLNKSFLVLMQQRQFPLNCPNLTCRKPVQYDDLSQILDEQGLEDYQQLTFKAYIQSHGEEYSWCPTPDCKYVFAQGEGDSFDCPVCKKSYCLKCQTEFHHGLSCTQYKEKIQAEKNGKNEKVLDEQFLQFVKGAKFKQCPQCKFWVEKNKGCDHMTCRCKFQFCYVCGGKYGSCKCSNNQFNFPFPRFGYNRIDFNQNHRND